MWVSNPKPCSENTVTVALWVLLLAHPLISQQLPAWQELAGRRAAADSRQPFDVVFHPMGLERSEDVSCPLLFPRKRPSQSHY